MSNLDEKSSHQINADVARKLDEYADLLASADENPFRVAAYHRAAVTIRSLPESLPTILEASGTGGLKSLAGIGQRIAEVIVEILQTGGRWQPLERLKGTSSPEHLFALVPGVGPELGRKIYEALHISTLEQLESAAWDGRLEQVEGFGRRRVQAVRSNLAEMLTRSRIPDLPDTEDPPVSLLLEIDRKYRTLAEQGKLRLVTPRRFNPNQEAWLPIMNESRGRWRMSALYSNTARAHQLQKTRDWVVIYYSVGATRKRQCTVVTAGQRDVLVGKRVVRGREQECREYYAEQLSNSTTSDN